MLNKSLPIEGWMLGMQQRLEFLERHLGVAGSSKDWMDNYGKPSKDVKPSSVDEGSK